MKKITIAIPTYNREILLTKLIKSIPENIDISISDNGGFITKTFSNINNNVSIIKHETVLDIFYNWNAAIKNIKHTDYIAIPSDDDMYYREDFNYIQDIIDSNGDIDIFIFGNNHINENDEVVGQYCPKRYKTYNAPEGLNEFLYGVDVRMPSVFFRKSFLDEIGYFDESSFTLTAADSELVQRALLLGRSAFIPKVISSYRVWSGSLTNNTIASKHWLDEIDIWTSKITKLANATLTKKQNIFNWSRYKDEIYARNLLGGLSNLYNLKNYHKLFHYYSEARYPKNAFLKTKLRIWKILILSKLKTLNVN